MITDGLTAKTMDWSRVKECLLGIFLLGLTLAIGRFLWRYFLFGTARKIERDIRNEMFAHLETLDVEYFHGHKTGDIMTRFTSDLNAVRMAMGPAVIAIFDAVVMTVMILFQMIVYVNWKLTLLAMVPMLLTKFKGKMLIEHILECTKDLFVKRVVVTRTKEILRLAYDDRQGTPILFDKKYFSELSELPEKKGGSFVAKKYPDKVSLIFAESEKELYDIDTKEDLARLEEMSADD